jgi:Protein of unknown function (DUF1554)
MKRCSRGLGIAMTLAMAAAAGCSSSDVNVGGPTEAGNPEASSDGAIASNDGAAATNDGPMASTDGPEAGDAPAASDVGSGLRDSGGDGRVMDAADAAAVCGPFAGGDGGPGDAGGHTPDPTMTFFVSSQKNTTGNLGGLSGADARCQSLAMAVGLGAKTWRAYLSVEHDASSGNGPTNARDRIGSGPWFNANGVMLAANLTALHARTGDPSVFIDENGRMINGQWTGSPAPLEHDILTGSNADGTLAPGRTCLDWTSAAGPDGGAPDSGELAVARVGHTDGFGPMCSVAMTPNNVTSWNSAHDNAGCNDTAPRGGAGRIYCFAIN